MAGSYLALGIVGSNPTPSKLKNEKRTLNKTKETLESGSRDEILELTRERLIGDLFIIGVYDYYVQYVSQSLLMGTKGKASYVALPMAGTFGYEPYQRKLFGLNRGIESQGVFMNIRTVQILQTGKGDIQKNKDFAEKIGMFGSILEHTTPEALFSKDGPVVGFSAAKALTIANSQSQKIYTFTKTRNNASQVLALDAGAMNEINAALMSGKEVIAHANQIAIPGFRGSGYIILDPDTGMGAYKISGGKNGSYAAIAASYRLDYGLMAWETIREDRNINERAESYSEVLRNAEHFLWAYSEVCDGGKLRAEVVTAVYVYFIAKAIIWDINFIKQGPITIPGVGTFDFRGSPVTWEQLVAGLHGAALGSECGLD